MTFYWGGIVGHVFHMRAPFAIYCIPCVEGLDNIPRRNPIFYDYCYIMLFHNCFCLLFFNNSFSVCIHINSLFAFSLIVHSVIKHVYIIDYVPWSLIIIRLYMYIYLIQADNNVWAINFIKIKIQNYLTCSYTFVKLNILS